MKIIEQTNHLVRVAICAFRIDPNAATRSGIYDALNRRRNARAYVMPKREADEWNRLAFTELSFGEKHAMIYGRDGGGRR